MSYRPWLVALLIPVAGSTGCNDPSGTSSPGGGSGTAYTGDGGMTTPGHELTVLAALGGAAYTLQIDSTSAYVLLTSNDTSDSTTILQVPLTGGVPVTLASDPQYGVNIAVSAAAVYWVDPSGPPSDASFSTGQVMSVPLGGGATTTVAGDQGGPNGVAVDSSGVYWIDANQCVGQPSCSGLTGAVLTLPPGGTTPVVLATVLTSPDTLALDATNVYWGTTDGRVMKVLKSGGTSTTLAFYRASVQNLVVDASNVYWTTGTGDIMETPIVGGSSTALVAVRTRIMGVAVDSTSLYWIAYDGEGTGAARARAEGGAGGGTPTTLWSGSDTPEAIQIDATSVYFTTASGELLKLTPK